MLHGAASLPFGGLHPAPKSKAREAARLLKSADLGFADLQPVFRVGSATHAEPVSSGMWWPVQACDPDGGPWKGQVLGVTPDRRLGELQEWVPGPPQS